MRSRITFLVLYLTAEARKTQGGHRDAIVNLLVQAKRIHSNMKGGVS